MLCDPDATAQPHRDLGSHNMDGAGSGRITWRLLDAATVETDDGPVLLSGRCQTVLIRLLIDRNRVVRSDQLVDALWGDDPPKTARNAIAQFVGGLRRKLGEAGSRIHTEGDGYRLEVLPDELDLDVAQVAFDSSGLSGLDADRAKLLLGLAQFDSWPNHALSSLCYGAESHLVRCEELRIALIERLGDQKLSTGEHRVLIARTEMALGTHPYHEGLWAQLMLALHRSGRHAEALRAYQRADAALEEIGLRPSATLRSVEAEILSADLTPDPAGDLPVDLTGAVPDGLPAVTTAARRPNGRRPDSQHIPRPERHRTGN